MSRKNKCCFPFEGNVLEIGGGSVGPSYTVNVRNYYGSDETVISGIVHIATTGEFRWSWFSI